MVEELPLGTWWVGSLMTWYKKKLEVTETNLEYKVLLWFQKSILKPPIKIKFLKKEVLRENKVLYKEFKTSQVWLGRRYSRQTQNLQA